MTEAAILQACLMPGAKQDSMSILCRMISAYEIGVPLRSRERERERGGDGQRRIQNFGPI